MLVSYCLIHFVINGILLEYGFIFEGCGVTIMCTFFPYPSHELLTGAREYGVVSEVGCVTVLVM